MLKKKLLSRHIYSQRQWWQARTVVTIFFFFLSHVNSVQSTDKFQTLKRKSPLKRIRIETYVTKIIAFKNYILSTLLPPVLCSTLSPRRETPNTTGLLYQCIPHTLTTTYSRVWIQTTTARSQQHFLIYDPSNTGAGLLRLQRAFYQRQDTLYTSPCPDWLVLYPHWHALHLSCDNIPPARAPVLAAALDWQLTF